MASGRDNGATKPTSPSAVVGAGVDHEFTPPAGTLRPSRKDLLTWIQRLLGVTPAPSRRELQRQRQFAIDEARWQAWWAARKRGVKYDDCSAAAAQDLAGTEAAGSADRVFKSYKLIQRRRRVGSPTGSKGRP